LIKRPPPKVSIIKPELGRVGDTVIQRCCADNVISVSTRATINRIGSCGGKKDIITAVTGQRVIAELTIYRVIIIATADAVITAERAPISARTR